MMQEEMQIPQQQAGARVAAPEDAQMAVQDIKEDVVQNFTEIDSLQEQGINVADIKKLRDAGYHTAQAVRATTRRSLMHVKGFSDAKVDKILDAVRKVTDAGFCTGVQLMTKMKVRYRLSTGSQSFNAILGGGIESGSITELYGEFRCGKTQICHAMSVISQLPQNMGGDNGKVCYIDTESTFRCERIAQIAQTYGVDSQAVLENIAYARCYSTDHLIELLIMIAARMTEEKYSLLIVDSIMGTLRVDYSGRGDLADRQQTLAKIMSKLQKLSEEFNCAVLITNQVMADPGGGLTVGPPIAKPVGGHILAHLSTTRVQLRKGRGEQRIAKIVDSPTMPENDAVYSIADRGIQDVTD